MVEAKEQEKKQEQTVSWTVEQQQVISLRNRNILVSAAAGSGKTAVLVERIITMISDREHPVDIDRLLVVTFTNAAAAEMSERIAAALEKKVENEPDNMHLRKQITLVRNAQICTFHSFCQSVIRNHFHEIGLDPAFRIGDDTELKLMKQDVLEQLFEEQYAIFNENKRQAAEENRELTEKERAFVNLVECYSGGKSDQALRDIVLALYEFAMSYPWPERWLSQCKEAFLVESLEQMEKTEWMKALLLYLRQYVEACLEKNEEALAICREFDGPDVYEENLLADREVLEELICCDTYEKYCECFNNLKWTTLSRKKGEQIDPDKREQVKNMRNGIKKGISGLQDEFFFQEPESMLADIQALAMPMGTLIEITLAFRRAFQAAKEEKRVVDFNDLEHYALAILVDEQGNPSPVAKSYQQHFSEILVDEYQDSNQVQETILQSIAKQEPQTPNLFMVGDVKQSIYKFRMARPELFMEKYESYSSEESLYQKIDLHKNFRSRGIVLDSANEIFRVIMQKSLGQVAYDESAALHLGNESFPEGEQVSKSTEILLYEPDKEEVLPEEPDDEEITGSKAELEARMVATRIKELVAEQEGLLVVDKKTGQLRNCQYGDIAILLRTMSGWSDVYLETLKNAGIPCYTDTKTGYFSTYEIRTILQFLKVLDNPRQDIPLAAVMRSVLGGFSAEEMAIMRKAYPDMDLLDTVEAYSGLHEYGEEVPQQDRELSLRADSFLKKIERYRACVSYLSIHELLEKIFEETGYYEFVSVMPNGNQRRDNLDMLVQKAIDAEGMSFNSLFHFNRYIEKLHKYEVDFGEAAGADTAGNAVHIMSIHKSKGLEFPVVIVGAMGKQFNNQDARSKLVLHLDMGIGADVIDAEKRTKAPSLVKRTIARQNVLENLGEELRVLYVALTRAKEKLIMAGYLDKPEYLENRWHLSDGAMDYVSRISAGNYLDWVMPVVQDSTSGNFEVRFYGMEDLVRDEVLEQVKANVKKSELLHWDTEQTYEPVFQQKLQERKEFLYPYEKEKTIKSKMTVSELKHMAMDLLEPEELGVCLFQPEPAEIPLPAFLQEEKEKSGAARGTIYHTVFEKLVMSRTDTEASITEQLEHMVQTGILTKEEAKLVRHQDIIRFAASPVGQRMKEAEQKGVLWREQPFVIGIPAREVNSQWDSQELVMIQGIIDVYFEEEDGLVLLDYKTDRVQTEQQLVDRYETQLEYYARALEQITGKTVKEKLLYAVSLGKEITIDM